MTHEYLKNFITQSFSLASLEKNNTLNLKSGIYGTLFRTILKVSLHFPTYLTSTKEPLGKFT